MLIQVDKIPVNRNANFAPNHEVVSSKAERPTATFQNIQKIGITKEAIHALGKSLYDARETA